MMSGPASLAAISFTAKLRRQTYWDGRTDGRSDPTPIGRK